MQELSRQCMLTALTEHIKLFSQSIADRSLLTCVLWSAHWKHSRNMKKPPLLVRSSQVNFICTALFALQTVSKQLYRNTLMPSSPHWAVQSSTIGPGLKYSLYICNYSNASLKCFVFFFSLGISWHVFTCHVFTWHFLNNNFSKSLYMQILVNWL